MCLVTQSCLTLCHPMDCSPPGSSVHGILQARILEWVAFPAPRLIKEILYSEDLLQRVWWGRGGLEQWGQLVVSLVIRKSPVQSSSSSKSSQSVPGIKLSNKSNWHSLGSFFPNLSFWKVAMLASSCSQSRKDGYLDAHSSGEQNRLLAL